MAYHIHTEGLDDEQREKFDEEIGMKENPEDAAQEALAAYQQQMGIDPHGG